MREQKPTHKEMMTIAVEASLSYVTVLTVYKGGGHTNSRDRVKQAAEKLGLPLPEEK